MSNCTPAQLMTAAPRLDARKAQMLCARFNPEPIGFGRMRTLGRAV